MRARAGGWVGPVLIAMVTVACSSSGSADVETTCRPDAPGGADPLRIVTSVAPITNIVATIAAGSDAEVVGVVPEGVNSHTFEPGPAVAAALEGADLVVLNGLDLEVPVRRLAAANVDDGVPVCELGDEILPEDEYIFDFSFPESAGSPNPHLWTNPPMAREYAGVVRDVLTALDPSNADRYADNDRMFAEQVDELDAALREATATILPDDRLLLTYHDAYAYFAHEYGWTVVGAVQPASFTEPTPRELAELIEQVRAEDVPVIFGSEVFPSPVLQQIAAETGAVYVDDLRDDDLPGDPGDAEHSWLGMMRLNFVTIIEALGGEVDALRSLDVAPTSPDTATYR